jgi:uncharacterized protein (TIGR02594 family)
MHPWMTVARKEIGQREKKGRGINSRIKHYYEKAGHPYVKDDDVPWCSAFANFVMESSGIRGTHSLAARSWLTWGRKVDPQIGAIVVLKRGTEAWQGHVGFITAVTPTHVKVLGGNQGDMVCEKLFPKAAILGCRMPPSMGASRTVSAQGVTLAGGGMGMAMETANSFLPLAQEASMYINSAMYIAFGLSMIAAVCTIYFRWQDMKEKGK